MTTSSTYKLNIGNKYTFMKFPVVTSLSSLLWSEAFPAQLMQVPEITAGLQRGGATWSVGHTSLGGDTSVKVWGGMLAGTSRSTEIKGAGGAADKKWPRGWRKRRRDGERGKMQTVDGDVLLHSAHGLVSAHTVYFSLKPNQSLLLLPWNWWPRLAVQLEN